MVYMNKLITLCVGAALALSVSADVNVNAPGVQVDVTGGSSANTYVEESKDALCFSEQKQCGGGDFRDSRSCCDGTQCMRVNDDWFECRIAGKSYGTAADTNNVNVNAPGATVNVGGGHGSVSFPGGNVGWRKLDAEENTEHRKLPRRQRPVAGAVAGSVAGSRHPNAPVAAGAVAGAVVGGTPVVGAASGAATHNNQYGYRKLAQRPVAGAVAGSVAGSRHPNAPVAAGAVAGAVVGGTPVVGAASGAATHNNQYGYRLRH